MKILVYADRNTLPSTQFMGTLDVQQMKGRNVF